MSISIEPDAETGTYTVFVQHDAGWVAKLVSGAALEDALLVAESDLEKLRGPDIEFRVGALLCRNIKDTIEALRTEATMQQHSETRLRAGAQDPWADEAATLPRKLRGS